MEIRRINYRFFDALLRREALRFLEILLHSFSLEGARVGILYLLAERRTVAIFCRVHAPISCLTVRRRELLLLLEEVFLAELFLEELFLLAELFRRGGDSCLTRSEIVFFTAGECALAGEILLAVADNLDLVFAIVGGITFSCSEKFF